jgi:predicted transcriptional regulator
MGTLSPIELAAEMVAAFVSNNSVPTSELPALIHAVHTAVARLAVGPESAPPQIEAKAPAVPIRKSITPDFLICLEDGKRFKTMRRHLAGLGLTPTRFVAPRRLAHYVRGSSRPTGLSSSTTWSAEAPIPTDGPPTRHRIDFALKSDD